MSTFNEKIKCLIVTPAIIASKNKDRDARSTTGVPVMPSGLMLPQGRPEVTGAPTVAVPNHVARARVERIHVIRFSRDDDHRGTAGAVLDVQRLCVDAAQNRAVEVQIPPQIRGGRSRKSRIDVKPVARYMVVLLRDVHLRLRWNDNRPSGDHPENGKEKFHPLRRHRSGPMLSRGVFSKYEYRAAKGCIKLSLN